MLLKRHKLPISETEPLNGFRYIFKEDREVLKAWTVSIMKLVSVGKLCMWRDLWRLHSKDSTRRRRRSVHASRSRPHCLQTAPQLPGWSFASIRTNSATCSGNDCISERFGSYAAKPAETLRHHTAQRNEKMCSFRRLESSYRGLLHCYEE